MRFFPILLLFFLLNCPQLQAADQPDLQTDPPALQHKSARLLEFPSQALELWANSQQEKPLLLLFSQDPFLQPIPKSLVQQIVRQIKDGTLDTKQLNPQFANPLLLPRMGLRAAIEANVFSSVTWVFPSQVEVEQLNLQLFREQLVESGSATPQEAESFSLQDNTFSGMINGTPFRAVQLDQLQSISGENLLHIDLSYFSPLYKGEIKTPLYPLLYNFVGQLQGLGVKLSSVSISCSNLDGNLPLSTRFVASTLERLFMDPQLLAQPLPNSWELRRKALYLDNFFQDEKIDEIYRQLKKDTPQDASVRYAYYQLLRKMKKGNEALDSLAEAVELEPAYGLEYSTLAGIAWEKKRPDQALKMLDLAYAALPENPFLQLQKAELLLKLGHPEGAIPLLKDLQQQSWSPVYYPQIPEYLQALLNSAVSPTKEN